MTTIREQTLRTLEVLRRAVAKELERKRRLGQYYVIWKDEKPVAIGEDAPKDSSADRG
jgi:hypothetical protein